MATDDMSLIVTLSELAQQVRHGTLQLLHATSPVCLRWSPPGTSNHILWHAGHALWVQDALTIEPLTGRSELPGGWEAVFGENSQPASTTSWPNVSKVSGLLDAQLRRVLELFGEHAETIGSHAYVASPQGGWPLLPGILHGWHDESRHQGEMYLLHKLCAASS
jgi:hypothetical protein